MPRSKPSSHRLPRRSFRLSNEPAAGFRTTFLALFIFAAQAMAEPVRLAGEGRALLPIVVGEKASAFTKATAAELARFFLIGASEVAVSHAAWRRARWR